MFAAALLTCLFEAEAQTTTEKFEIARQSLGSAIKELARQSGMQIALLSEDAGAKEAAPVSGSMSVEEALSLLLQDTGLVYRYVNKRTIIVASSWRFAEDDPSPRNSNIALPRSSPRPDPPLRQDTIIVTALKRDQDLQDTPASINVIPGETLEADGAKTLQDVARLTPNFLSSSFNNTLPIFSIRGASNTFSAIATNKPVGIYINEIYIPRFSAADFDFFDIEKIEVLRGPQGTFFGRNVAGGAVLLTTKAPSEDRFDARMLAEIGSKDALSLKGALSGPMSEQFAVKLSAGLESRSGYGRDVLTGHEQDDLDQTFVRSSVMWRPANSLEVLISGDYSRDKSGGRTLSAIYEGDDDRRTSEVGIDQMFDREIYGGSVKISYTHETGVLTSITGARFSDSTELYSRSGLYYPLILSGFQQVDRANETPSTVSSELRFVSKDFDRFSFIAGLYLLAEESGRRVDITQYAPTTGDVIKDVTLDQDVTTRAWAGYIDGTWRLSPKIDLIAGLRYGDETRRAALINTDRLAPASSFASPRESRSFDILTPRLSLIYRPADDLTFYLSSSRGFSAGGFNTEADTLEEFSSPFGPETVMSVEAGAKVRLYDERAYINAAIFTQDYHDKQEFVLNQETSLGTILNAAEASMKGVEIEMGWRVSDYLTANAAYGYLDARYDDFQYSGGIDYSGNRLASSPKHQLALRLESTRPVSEGRAELFGSIGYSLTSGYYPGASNERFIEGYGLLNASVGLRSRDGKRSIEIYGTNWLDEDYTLITTGFGGVEAEYLGEPRLFGLRLRYNY